MFCSHCGTDCRGANFCPKCGRAVGKGDTQQSFAARKKALQASGEVFCPKCLSTNYSKVSFSRDHKRWREGTASVLQAALWLARMENRKKNGVAYVCEECGNTWYSQRETLAERYKESLSKILGEDDSMEYPGVRGTSLLVNRYQVQVNRLDGSEIKIPHEQLTGVSFHKNLGPLYGWIAIREQANGECPFPQSYLDAEKDDYVVFYDFNNERNFFQLYEVLKEIAEQNETSRQ